MKKYIYIISLLGFLILCENAIAQIEGSNMVFPATVYNSHGGTLNFACNGVHELKPELHISENDATNSICDTSGNLIFYIVNGLIFDNNNVAIATIGPGTYAFSDVLIVPFPGHQNEFYIVFDNNNGKGNYYCIYNTLSKTLSKRDSFGTPQTYCSATKHHNKKDYWLVYYNHDSLFSYLVDSNGINEHGIFRSIPENSSAYLNSIQNSIGNKLYILTNFSWKDTTENYVVSIDFDNATGLFSNQALLLSYPAKFNYGYGAIGISPDSKQLYIRENTSIDSNGNFPYCNNCVSNILQFDISSNDSNKVKASKTEIVHAIRDGIFIQGPDMKLYVMETSIGLGDTTHLSMISNPDKAGKSCGFQMGNIKVGYRFHPEFLTRQGYWPSFSIDTDALNPFVINLSYNAPLPGETYKWDLGDLASGKFNTGTSANISHTFALGSYMVRLAVTSKDGYNEVFKRKICLGSPFLQAVHDTSVCGPVTLDAGNPWASHLWSTGDTTEKATLRKPGKYWVKLQYGNQQITYNFNIKYDEAKTHGFLPKHATVCENVTYIINLDSLHGIVKWQDSFVYKTITINQKGIYHASLENSCGIYKDSIQVNFETCLNPVITVFPNPFDNVVQIQVELIKAAQVQISVYDAIGRLITNIANNQQPIGFQNYVLDGSLYHLATGIYFLKIVIDEKVYMEKVVKE